jgi:hypothetical protein
LTVLAIFVSRGLWKSWRVFCLLLIVDLSVTAASLQFDDITSSGYRFIYQFWAYSGAVLQLAVSVELYLHVCSSYYIRGKRWVAALIISAGAILLSICPICQAVGSIDERFSAASSQLFMFMILGISGFCALTAEMRNRSIIIHARCLTLYFGANALAGSLLLVWRVDYSIANTVLYVGQSLAFLGWIAFMRPVASVRINVTPGEQVEWDRRKDTEDGLRRCGAS